MQKRNVIRKIECMVLLLLIFCISHLIAEPCGDVNSKDGINIVDALLIAQFYVGLNPADFDEAAADVNADGKINIVDALLVAQLYVGLITELPGCIETNTKARVIATTDGETDDRSSMVRFLMYAGDFDVEGIVQVNGVQASGHSGDHWIEALIDKYDQVLPNLRVHNPDYPSKEYLLSVLKVGNENSGDRNSPPPTIDGKEGAQLMIDRLLDDDMRLVHILSWGGANTTANALWQIKEHYSAAEWQRAVEKARVYCIWFQDGGGKWIKTNLPEVKIYGASVDDDGDNNDASWRYVWDYMSVDGYWKGRDSANPQALQVIMDKPWLRDHITSNHGPLCAAYGQSYTSEGDTPSFMPCIDNGLEQFNDYTLGGWGGRPVFVANVGNGNYMEDGSDECWSSDSSLCNHGGEDLHYPFQRWLVAAQNDWASHADWCVASTYGEANHQPVVSVAGGAVRDVSPGDVITLDASGSTDPDGNNLSVRWWQYHEADSANTKIVISNETSMNNASFVVPNEPNKQLHVICEVIDDGDPPLRRYQRIIFNIQ